MHSFDYRLESTGEESEKLSRRIHERFSIWLNKRNCSKLWHQLSNMACRVRNGYVEGVAMMTFQIFLTLFWKHTPPLPPSPLPCPLDDLSKSEFDNIGNWWNLIYNDNEMLKILILQCISNSLKAIKFGLTVMSKCGCHSDVKWRGETVFILINRGGNEGGSTFVFSLVVCKLSLC